MSGFMNFLKAQWRILAFAAICLASIGSGAWAYFAGADVATRLQEVDRLRSEAENQGRTPVNRQVIEARRKEIEQTNADIDKALKSSLAMQFNNAFESKNGQPTSRATLIKDVLPEPKTRSAPIEFRHAYKLAVAELFKRLHGRGKPTPVEVTEVQARIEQLKTRRGSGDTRPWAPTNAPAADTENAPKGPRNLNLVLSEYGRARAAEEIAYSIYTYVEDNAIGHHRIQEGEDPPTDIEIWQAQMSLWIQQDLIYALAKCNEQRAAALRAQKHDDRLWVAYMPVKRLVALRIDNRLGRGGGSNLSSVGFSPSFTGMDNNATMFVVPLKLELVVEESAIISVIDTICSVGFYTPTNINYKSIKPNPLQEDYIYGDQPVVDLTLDLEGYYFRKVYDQWIPKALKAGLARPGAVEEQDRGR